MIPRVAENFLDAELWLTHGHTSGGGLLDEDHQALEDISITRSDYCGDDVTVTEHRRMLYHGA